MPHLFVYLLKVNVALILFYLAYRFLLRPLTFYSLNRFFLIFGILFSSLYPFANLSYFFSEHQEISSRLIIIVPDWDKAMPAQTFWDTFNYWSALSIVFWCGVIFMAVRLIIQFASLYQIHKDSTPYEKEGKSFRHVADKINPFSFLRNIYVNADSHEEEELDAILKHEMIHVMQWHSVDVILAELSAIFYWFNPGVWLMKQAVKENLEFITDEKVLQDGVDSKAYQYSLVRISTLENQSQLVNNFNLGSIRQRIVMMNKDRSSFVHISKYILLLPVVMIMVMAFTVSKAQLIQTKMMVGKMISSVPQILKSTLTNETVKTDQKASISNFNNQQASAVSTTDTTRTKFKPENIITIDSVERPIKTGGAVLVENWKSKNPQYYLNGLKTTDDVISQIPQNSIVLIHVGIGATVGPFKSENGKDGVVTMVFTTDYSKYEAAVNLMKELGDVPKQPDKKLFNIAADVYDLSAKNFPVRSAPPSKEATPTDKFVVQPDSKLEDVLKQFPGVKLDKDGNATINGQPVQKVLVDGKELPARPASPPLTRPVGPASSKKPDATRPNKNTSDPSLEPITVIGRRSDDPTLPPGKASNAPLDEVITVGEHKKSP